MTIAIEWTVNEKGEAVAIFRMPIPPSVDPKDYDRIAAIFTDELTKRLMRQ